MSATRTAYATCPLCEATCGLEFQIDEGDRVTRISGDAEDVLSHGFVCPKGASLKPLHEDPDRLRAPLVRRNGRLEEATWEEAFAEVERRLPPLLEESGRDAVAVYVGNPNAHNLAALLYGRVLIKALGTRNIYSASTVDQMPKQIAAGLMFGTILSVPVPDMDRTDHLLILGANPLQSNGSLLTAPDMRGRIRRIRSASTPTASRWCADSQATSRRRRLPRRAGSPRPISGVWRGSWRPPRARPCTAGSARARRSSGRLRAGWWTY